MADSDFRLSPAERAGCQPDLDLDALERLLGTLPAEARPLVLRLAWDWAREDPEACLAAFPEVTPGGPPGRRSFVVPQLSDLRSDDPALQAAIDAVLAPRRRRGAGQVPAA